MKTIILFMLALLTVSVSKSQNITNTLGDNGAFIVKSTDSVHLKMLESNGFLGLGVNPTQQLSISRNFSIPATTGVNAGIIFKDGYRYIHNYNPPGTKGNNLFFGLNSGNLTMLGNNDDISSHNTAVGDSTLMNLTRGGGNTAVGTYSMLNTTTGNQNTGFGSFTLRGNTTGNSNTAVGFMSLLNNQTANNNTAVGFLSLFHNSTGAGNTALGYSSLSQNSTGQFNTAVGQSSLNTLAAGSFNTSVGMYSGSNLENGSNNTYIGYNAQPSTVSVSNQIVLGNNQVTTLRCNVQSITSLSDMRDKKNIKDLSLGLDFINKLKPRQFKWDKREWYEENNSDGSKMEEKYTAGFIAQELDEMQTANDAEWLGLVMKDNPEKMEATYGNLLPVMVKAIQELKKENDELKENIGKLDKEIADLKNEFNFAIKLFEEVSGNIKTNLIHHEN